MGDTKTVKVRILEMSEGHKGLDMPRKMLAKLATRAPALGSVPEEKWAAMDGPLVKVPMDVVRVLLRWATTGQLRYERRHTKAVYNALLKTCGNKAAAGLVKQYESSPEASSKLLVKKT